MDKLKMHTPDLAEENYKKLAALFPDAVTETKDENGNTVRAIDKDVLMQEINAKVVDDGQERYQFTWPDKRKAVVLANAPIAKTLRFEKEKSVGRDGTPGGTDSENIYIEGDNLDALKLLQETYLGKVKMIYIDPPYNTGNDFIYEDDFSQKAADYAENSGQTDEEGNRLVQNSESNGRFHTDWLNMLYPRLRIAKDLLTDDGVIFISIDDNEQENLKKICNEIFGKQNFEGHIHWRRRHNQPNDKTKMIGLVAEHILTYAKDSVYLKSVGVGKLDLTASFKNPDNDPNGPWASKPWKVGSDQSGSKYEIVTPTGKVLDGEWMGEEATYKKFLAEGRIYFPKGGDGMPRKKYYQFEREEEGQCATNWWPHEQFGNNQEANNQMAELFGIKNIFSNPKPVKLIRAMIKIANVNAYDICMDFFSGSATTAHALMELNAEERRNRKFILVQLPETPDKKSEAYKAGYKTICDIGEERIRRAGKKIKEETGADIDYGFRCFRVDSSNMKDVYYKPSDVKQGELDLFTDNIKEDRTPEDLLIQVMLDLGVLLSSKVEEEEIAGKKVFSVADGYLIACFDRDVTDDVVTAIARKHPFYAVFRDSSFSSDSVAANFEQIFDTYSPQTVRKVL
ncbi:site-specific DNA-methyltransferase [Dialister hominis]|uniref:site-specific DNA-methyltransferase n=1 Tax=Dialister hominis TaxID=2582419 RepID=UPI003AF80289